MSELYCSIAGVTHPRSVVIEEAYSAITSSAVIEADSTTLSLGDPISIDIGYSDDHEILFSGYTKKIEAMRPDGTVRITAFDVLVKAVDYFIAADDPENPLTFHNVSSRDFVNGILAEASLPNVVTAEPTPVFTWGTNADGAKINLQSAADTLTWICGITGNTIYATVLGNIHFEDRKPYIVGGDVSTYTFSSALHNIIDIHYEETTDPTRNVVKVYGKTPIVAQASAANPYLVVDQTLVVAHELLDTQEICDNTASVNLTMLNRLGKTFTITAVGDTTIRARNIATVMDDYVQPTPVDVFISRANHNWGVDGYTTSVTCTF